MASGPLKLRLLCDAVDLGVTGDNACCCELGVTGDNACCCEFGVKFGVLPGPLGGPLDALSVIPGPLGGDRLPLEYLSVGV